MNKLFAILTLGAALGATGCSHDYRVDFHILTNAPPDVLVTGDLIEMPAGMAVGVRATAVIDGKRKDDIVELFPQRTNIFGIEPSIEERTWVIWAKNPGSTAVEIFIDGDYVGDIAAVGLEPVID
jgi:hypothetical protein